MVRKQRAFVLSPAYNLDRSIFATTDKQQDLNTVRSEIMSYALNDPVAWYTIVYAGASHHAYVS